MFLFGFLFLVVVTQMHGLGLARAIRWASADLTIAAVLAVYSQNGWEMMNEVVCIPAINNALVFVLGDAILAPKKLGVFKADREG